MVTVRTMSHGESLQIGDDLTVTVEFPDKGGRRVKLIVRERPRYPVRPIVCADDGGLHRVTTQETSDD